ncbi:MAG: L,D-transpeptidase family protein, partial [Arenimonas sp.]
QFAWQPQLSPSGPLLVLVSLREQLAYVYRNGLRIGRSSVSTGKKGYETPIGVFTILQKHQEHYSNLYDNAPMPFMQRLTWSGVALHAGNVPGYPASHGCVRLPYAFSELLFGATTTGVTVVIAEGGTAPTLVSGELLATTPAAAAMPDASVEWTWHPERALQGPLTIVLSTRDRRVVVLRDAIEIGRSTVTVTGDAPVGTTAYMLLEGRTDEPSQIVPGRMALRWMSVSGDGAAAQTAPLAVLASRLAVPASFSRQVYDALTDGTTVVITDEALRSGEGDSALTILRADAGPGEGAEAGQQLP